MMDCSPLGPGPLCTRRWVFRTYARPVVRTAWWRGMMESNGWRPCVPGLSFETKRPMRPTFHPNSHGPMANWGYLIPYRCLRSVQEKISDFCS